MLRNNCLRSKLEYFFLEIRCLAYLKKRFPNGLQIPKIFDFNFSGKFSTGKPVVYYTMEFIELGEFFGCIEIQEEIAEELGCWFLVQILEILAILHNQQVYHFDLKLENVLMNELGDLFLCDFGHCLNLMQEKKIKWKNVHFKGSYEYSAPEVYELEILQATFKEKLLEKKIQNYDLKKLDMFSIGVLLFVTIMKSLPFSKATLEDCYFNKFIKNKNAF